MANLRQLKWWLALGTTLLGGVASASPPPALTPAQEAVMWTSPQDSEPKTRQTVKKENEGQHFLYCDELYLDLFEPELRGVGGGYVGVGSDQGYLMAGWMRAEWVWLSDYDPVVVRLHRIYGAFFRQAADFVAFEALWRDGKLGTAALQTQEAASPDLAKLLSLYKQQRHTVARRLDYLKRRLGKLKIRGFVNDAGEYDHIRQLVIAKRVRPMLANLLADKGIAGIGAAAQQLGVTVRALYLSNAEQYWSYGKVFRDNVRALPFAADGVVLRTVAVKPNNGDYNYYVQAASRFVDKLSDPKVRHAQQLVPGLAVPADGGKVGLASIDAEGKHKVRWADLKGAAAKPYRAKATGPAAATPPAGQPATTDPTAPSATTPATPAAGAGAKP